ncbi:MAG: ABC transporter permease [bacterium]|nr:ABC transporter permease [bacterium]
MTSSKIRQNFIFSLLLLTFLVLTLTAAPWRWTMSWLFPSLDKVIYDLVPFPRLVMEHLILVSTAGVMATAVGLAAGITVTRPWGRDLLQAVNGMASLGQTFPPVAVLAIAVPVVGFGFKPTVIALFLYGVLPVIRNTIAGIQAVDPDIPEAAAGMGMTPAQILTRVELPLAWPVILTGIRISTIIGIGTATLGATIGAGGLGRPIIAGLIGENPAYILEGAVLVGLFAVIVDLGLGKLEGKSSL